MSRANRCWSRAPWGAILLVCLTFGCGDDGPPRIPVSGTVSVGGEPVREGVVSLFSPTTGDIWAGKLDDSGHFTIEGGAVVGDYVVTVRPPISEVPAGAPAPATPKQESSIPRKYHSDTTSDLRTTISEETEELTLELKP